MRRWLLLYWWPDDGWQRGTVARLCPRGAFSQVVAYTRQTSVLRGTVDTLLNAASYGTRWVTRLSALSSGPRRRGDPGPPAPGPSTLSLSLVCGSSPLPGPGRAGPGRCDQRSFALRMVCVRWSP